MEPDDTRQDSGEEADGLNKSDSQGNQEDDDVDSVQKEPDESTEGTPPDSMDTEIPDDEPLVPNILTSKILIK